MPMPEKFAFVCINERDDTHPRPSCLRNGSGDVFTALREEQGRRVLTSVKIVAGGCMEACMVGPVIAVYPDDVWYGGVIEDDVPEIVDHLQGGVPVQRLLLTGEEWDLRPPEMTDRPPPTA
jgi:(2Fe-2S) ferredoxin